MIGAPNLMAGVWLTEVRDAAVDYVRHGWPVRPSAPTCNRAKTATAVADGEITDVDVALSIWTQAAYPILLSCGSAVTAIEISNLLSRNALGALRGAGVLGPIIAAPFGTDYLLVEPSRQRREREGDDDVGRCLADGSQVILPPTGAEELLYRWRISPTAVGWQLPNVLSLQRELLRFLTRGRATPCHIVRSGHR